MFSKAYQYVLRVLQKRPTDSKNLLGHLDWRDYRMYCAQEHNHALQRVPDVRLNVLSRDYPYTDAFSLSHTVWRNACLEDPSRLPECKAFRMLSKSNGDMKAYASTLAYLNKVLGYPVEVAGGPGAQLDALDLCKVHRALEDAIVYEVMARSIANKQRPADAISTARLAKYKRLPLFAVIEGRGFSTRIGHLVRTAGFKGLAWIGVIALPALITLFLFSTEISKNYDAIAGFLPSFSAFLAYFLLNNLAAIVATVCTGMLGIYAYRSYRLVDARAVSAIESTISASWEQVLQRKTDGDILLINLLSTIVFSQGLDACTLLAQGRTPQETFRWALAMDQCGTLSTLMEDLNMDPDTLNAQIDNASEQSSGEVLPEGRTYNPFVHAEIPESINEYFDPVSH